MVESAATPPRSTGGHLAAARLLQRELVRLGRQPSRLVGALGAVAVLWLVMGAGFGGSVVVPGGQEGMYAGYLLGGMAALVVVFTAVFGAISLIEDRHAGFLQGVLVSPVPRWSVVLAKVGGGSIVGLTQAALLLLAAPAMGLSPGPVGALLALLAMAMLAAGVIGLGLAAAWWVDSVAGFHGVMNLVLMPMWLLSGSLFPAEGATGWMRVVMTVNPMSWPVRAVQESLGAAPAGSGWIWLGSLAFALLGPGLAWFVMSRERGGAGLRGSA